MIGKSFRHRHAAEIPFYADIPASVGNKGMHVLHADNCALPTDKYKIAFFL